MLMMLLGRWLSLNNRTSKYIVSGLIVLSIIGIVSKLISDPVGVIKTLAVVALVGAVIYFLVRRFSGTSPGKQQQRAFLKAAKRSKKRFQTKETSSTSKRSKIRSLASARTKKKDASHLTVIDGKKGKKKNRASF
jgi:lipopolysaccharide export LptBFGC system permease protein LptF